MKPVLKSVITEMKSEYQKSLHKMSTENLRKKFPDKPLIQEAQSAWVSKKDLLALLEDNKANGLRIHYGCHHESTNTDPKADLLGLHNVILVATIDNVNPDNPTTENSIDQLSDTADTQKAANLVASDATDSYAGSGGDLLPLCPPNCPK